MNNGSVYAAFGERVSKLRANRGLSQDDVAKDLGEPIVYITEAGSKYHISQDCQYVKGHGVDIDLDRAEKLDKTPCSVCYPK